jgi:hypothetical protein
MNIYTIKEFSEKQFISVRAMNHRLNNPNYSLPENHFLKRGGKENMIINCSPHEYKAGEYYDACCEFHARKSRYEKQIELCAELSVKYDIGITKLVKLLGV